MLRDVLQERDSLSDTPAPKSGTNRAKGTAEQAPRRAPGRAPGRAAGRAAGRAPGSTYWLIARNENSRLEVLATGLADTEEAMPVFSHEEEAELFLGLWEVGVGRLAGQGEQCRGTRLIALWALRERGAGGPRPFAGDARQEDCRAREPEQKTLRRAGVE